MNAMEKRIEKIMMTVELKIQDIDARMPEYKKWGSDRYYRHRRQMLVQELEDLRFILNGGRGNA